MADPGVRQPGPAGRPGPDRPELDRGQRSHRRNRPGRGGRHPTTPSSGPAGLDRADLPDRHGHQCGQGAEHHELLHGPHVRAGMPRTTPGEMPGVVFEGLHPYRHRWRCLSTWWAPPPSKRVGRAIPVRRVRFPSTSASRGTGADRRTGALQSDPFRTVGPERGYRSAGPGVRSRARRPRRPAGHGRPCHCSDGGASTWHGPLSGGCAHGSG